MFLKLYAKFCSLESKYNNSKNTEKPGYLFGKPDSEELEGEENEILEIKHTEDETEEIGIEISTEKLVQLQNEQQYMHI